MNGILKRLLIKAVQDYAQKTFTFENLKLVRDRLLLTLKAEVSNTETQIDDWAYDMLARMLADDNLQKIFDWVIKYADAMFNSTICTADPEHTLGALGKELDFTEDNNEPVCAMPALLTVVQILEVIMPVLYDWFKKTTK